MTHDYVNGQLVGESSTMTAPQGKGRLPMNVAPEVRERLRNFLFHPEMRGVGYSEFVTRALNLADMELEHRRRTEAENAT